jgi:cob(I)alamin adenosyltransferase
MTKRKPNTPLTVIRTGGGDTGMTSLGDQKVPKVHVAIVLLAQLDLLNAKFGLIDWEYWPEFLGVADDLFTLGAWVHMAYYGDPDDGVVKRKAQAMEKIKARTAVLENLIERHPVKLEGFVLPYSQVNELRAMTRLVECQWWQWATDEPDAVFGKYLNVLSDALFAADVHDEQSIHLWYGVGEEEEGKD